MNKTPIITIIALLTVMLIAFSGCEFDISLNGENNTETSVEAVVVTDEEGSTHVETIVHQITTEPVPVVTVVEVTNDDGKVVATEKVTLSPDEVQQGKDFFGSNDVSPTKESSKNETGKNSDKNPNKNPDKNSDKNTDKTPDKNTEKTTTEKSEVVTTEISNTPSPDRVTTAPADDNKPVQDDFEVLNSSKYLIEGRVVSADGVTYPYKMARDGNRFTFRSVFNGEEMCLIMGSKYVYLLSPKDKTYAKVSKEFVQEESGETGEFDDLMTGDVFNLYANKKEVDTYTEKISGVKYKVVEYDDGTMDYFNGKTLVYTTAKDGSILYYDVISTDVTEGLFVPPADYKEEVLTTQAVTETTTKASEEN